MLAGSRAAPTSSSAPRRGRRFLLPSASTWAEAKQLKEKGLSFGEISKELASMWSELSQEDKAPYDEMARLEKLKYQEESAEERWSAAP